MPEKKNTMDIEIEDSTAPSRSQSMVPSDSASSAISSNFALPVLSRATLKRKQSLLGDFILKTTEKQKDCLDVIIARFFYGNNIPFNVASSQEFKEMIHALRPGYTGPDRFQLSGKLLDTVLVEVDEEIKIELQSESCGVTLLQDGWSNIRNDPIIANSIHTGQSSFLLNATDCESNQKTAEYCAESAKKAIEECEERYGKKVSAVCTDNENKMLKMRDILNKDFPDLLTYGCSAHYINLLEEEVTPKAIIKHIVEVHKYFRNHHQPHGWLKEKKGRMPQLPNSTRWNSQQECLSTFVENYTKYVEIMTEHTAQFPANLIKVLENVTIYREAVHLLKQLSFVSKTLDLLQSDSTNIAQAVELWTDLLENPDLEPYKSAIQKRMNQALQPFHFLANQLDPRYRGARVSSVKEDIAEEWLMERHPDWVAPLLAFKIHDPEFFPPSMFLDSVIKQFTPVKWWQIMETKSRKKGNLPDGFCEFVQNISSCPASSASIERVFSTYGLVWSKLRNQLGCTRAEKLVRIYKFLHKKSKNK